MPDNTTEREYEDDDAAEAGIAAMERDGWRLVRHERREPRAIPARLGAHEIIVVSFERGE